MPFIKKHIFHLSFFFLLLSSCSLNSNQFLERCLDQDLAYLQHIVRSLSSQEMSGRFTGSPGEIKARNFIMEELIRLDLKPFDNESYFQEFPFSIHGKKMGTAYSVIAKIPSSTKNKKTPLIIGAHYDHLGNSFHSASLARNEEKSDIHVGADDNASGVSSLLLIASMMQKEINHGSFNPSRDIYFAFWSGEELGLLGSTFFTKQDFFKALEQNHFRAFLAYLNMDMVGRLDTHLLLQGLGSSPDWKEVLGKSLELSKTNLVIKTQDTSLLPTDTIPFYLNNIPVLSAFTGLHEDYHTPNDTADKINYQGIRDISHLFLHSIKVIDKIEEDITFERKEDPDSTQGISKITLYLGTIPDYSESTEEGLLISGVSPGSPAEKAGMKRGDIVNKLEKKEVTNIYDYTEAIQALSEGKETDIIIIREGKKNTLKITPVMRVKSPLKE
jgi:hypothetical protein